MGEHVFLSGYMSGSIFTSYFFLVIYQTSSYPHIIFLFLVEDFI